jgi:hypothetical protein
MNSLPMHFLSQSNQLGFQIFCLSNFNDNLEKILSLMRDPVIGRIEAVTVRAKFRQDEGDG